MRYGLCVRDGVVEVLAGFMIAIIGKCVFEK